jgi:hypothetical protein
MRLMCAERDALWEAYDRALKAYTDAVSRFTNELHARGDELKKARTMLDDARVELRRHCGGHGCDGDPFPNHF